MTILDGKNVSAQVKERVKNEALNLKNQGIEPARIKPAKPTSRQKKKPA